MFLSSNQTKRGIGKLSGGAALCALLLALMTSAYGQMMVPKSAPLYGPRPELGSVQESGIPQVLKDAKIDQKLGSQMPLEARFKDELGRDVRLGDYFGKKPVVLAFVYYDCPMLCTQVLNGLTAVLKAQSNGFSAGNQFEVVVIGFDARETPAQAQAKKTSYMARYDRPGTENSWHFLTGDENAIQQATQAAGFNFRWDEQTKQFAHASAIMVVTPEGKLSHYFYGIEYGPQDVRLALVEASDNKIGSPVDTLLLYCYHYDPSSGKYGFAIMRAVRAFSLLTLVGLVALIFFLKRKKSRHV